MFIFAKHAIAHGGSIHPIIIPANKTGGLGLMNASILNDGDKLLVNLRQVNYTFYHSEAKLFQHPYGPLTYVHPENDLHLRTWNWYCELDDSLNITRYDKVDTSAFDTYTPAWDFVGLEDARLVRWEDKLYLSGVRRDTTPHGQGRMELSEIEVRGDSVVEISRHRIPTPKDPDSYCEKNWMPILERPYHYIKWTDPTELVHYDTASKQCTTVLERSYTGVPISQRGGSQVLRVADGWLALTHEVDLFNSETGRKDAVYRHRFVLWDEAWNLVKWSRAFSLMGGHVEFAVGMCTWRDKVLISYGFQDNAAYILRTDLPTIMAFINE
jgi:predicted GH43/DUF377 family glycosyl hydrolase